LIVKSEHKRKSAKRAYGNRRSTQKVGEMAIKKGGAEIKYSKIEAEAKSIPTTVDHKAPHQIVSGPGWHLS